MANDDTRKLPYAALRGRVELARQERDAIVDDQGPGWESRYLAASREYGRLAALYDRRRRDRIARHGACEGCYHEPKHKDSRLCLECQTKAKDVYADDYEPGYNYKKPKLHAIPGGAENPGESQADLRIAS